VDTKISVYLNGTFYAESDDRAPGDLSSTVGILVGSGGDVWVEVVIENRGDYATSRSYSITAVEYALTPTPSAMNLRRGPGRAAWFEPLGRRVWAAQQEQPPAPQPAQPEQPTQPAAQPAPAGKAVEFVIVLELKLEEPPPTPTSPPTPTLPPTAVQPTPTQEQ